MLDVGAFIVKEGEEAIVEDGAADASAELLLIVLGLASVAALVKKSAASKKSLWRYSKARK